MKPLVDLLLCAIRSCDDFEEPFPFSFEIHSSKAILFSGSKWRGATSLGQNVEKCSFVKISDSHEIENEERGE